MHYLRVKKGITDMRVDPLPKKGNGWGWHIRPRKGLCTLENCENPHYAKGFCRDHWGMNHKHGNPYYTKPPKPIEKCYVSSCRKIAVTSGMCSFHYTRKRNGVPFDRPKGNSGSLNVQWKGGVAMYPNHHTMKKIRIMVLTEENHTCHYCGKFTNQIHHKDHSKDNHKRKNLTACCHTCNLKMAGPKKTSKYIRLYGKTLKEIGKDFRVAETTILMWHRKNILKDLLMPDEVRAILC